MMHQKPDEPFATYVRRLMAMASKVVPPVAESEQLDIIVKTTTFGQPPY